MRLAQVGATSVEQVREVCCPRVDLRAAPVRPIQLPVQMVRHGKNYQVLDGDGRMIGTIPSPEFAPRLGRREGTVYLWREN